MVNISVLQEIFFIWLVVCIYCPNRVLLDSFGWRLVLEQGFGTNKVIKISIVTFGLRFEFFYFLLHRVETRFIICVAWLHVAFSDWKTLFGYFDSGVVINVTVKHDGSELPTMSATLRLLIDARGQWRPSQVIWPHQLWESWIVVRLGDGFVLFDFRSLSLLIVPSNVDILCHFAMIHSRHPLTHILFIASQLSEFPLQRFYLSFRIGSAAWLWWSFVPHLNRMLWVTKRTLEIQWKVSQRIVNLIIC